MVNWTLLSMMTEVRISLLLIFYSPFAAYKFVSLPKAPSHFPVVYCLQNEAVSG
jgi:hypothetical protein